MASPHRPQEIFENAIDLKGDERDAYLRGACGTDDSLRAEVDGLLRAHERAAGFLASPTGHVEVAAATLATPLREGPGTRIGPYKILQLIGEGGFGSVFMAEQEKPVARKVALKIIKLGMDTRQVIARFEAERQALATMDHPNIAKVLDAGATETGRPYFAMEYIKGVPILEYCDTDKLDTKARLGLFSSVCHAIQHAHQKGIIHRDIKPSNVLVTMHDGVAVPKVIDFGIAKATSSELTAKTLFTEHRQMIGTPAYMSPEQAEMSGLDIDTRSDIYSLGVLLYELLTGTTPFDSKSLMEAGFAEMMRIIREVEPHKPSTRLSSLGDTGTRTAQQRHVGDVKKLGLILRGDLDWIVMKCLEKDRTRRYETANGLAADIKRHLNDETVTAGAPSAGYKLRKFVKRNRARVIAAGVVAGALVLGVIGTTAGMIWALNEKDRANDEKTRATLAAKSEAAAKVQAQENEQKAIAEAKRAETISEFVTTALQAADAEMFGHQGGTKGAGQDMTILAAMDNAIKDIDSGRFKDDPETEARLRATIGMILKNNGRLAEAEPLMREALETHRRVLGDEHPDTLAAIANMGHLLRARGKLAEAEPYYYEALEKFRRVLGDEHPDTLTAINNMGVLLWTQYKLAEAEPYFREALDKRPRVLGDEHPNTLLSISNMGALLQAQGRLTEAEPYFREALERCRRVLGDEHPKTLKSLNDVGDLLQVQGKLAEAEPYFREALEMSRRLFKGDHPDVARCLGYVASDLLALGRAAEAEPLFVQALEMNQRLFKGDHPEVASSLNNVANDLLALGRAAEAEQLFVESLEMRQRMYKGDHPAVAMGLDNVAKTRQNLGRAAEAEPLLARALEMRRRLYTGDHPDLATGLNNLASVRQELGHVAEAEQLYVESLEMRQRLYKGDHPAVATALNNLALARQVLGKTAEARQGFDQALAMLRRFSPDGSPLLARALWRTGRARFENEIGVGGGEDAAAALPELEEAVAMAEKFLPPEHPHLKQYRETLAKCKAALAEQAKPDANGGGG